MAVEGAHTARSNAALSGLSTPCGRASASCARRGYAVDCNSVIARWLADYALYARRARAV